MEALPPPPIPAPLLLIPYLLPPTHHPLPPPITPCPFPISSYPLPLIPYPLLPPPFPCSLSPIPYPLSPIPYPLCPSYNRVVVSPPPSHIPRPLYPLSPPPIPQEAEAVEASQVGAFCAGAAVDHQERKAAAKERERKKKEVSTRHGGSKQTKILYPPHFVSSYPHQHSLCDIHPRV